MAVIDSGLTRTASPQLAAMKVADATDIVDPSYAPLDCANHGTGVAAIIAAPEQPGSLFVGVAPSATVVPIKQVDLMNNGTTRSLAAAIVRAAADGVQVANLSLSVGRNADLPILAAAIRIAQQRHVVLVCAADNQGANGNPPRYPAAWSTRFDNVIAVSGVDRQDQPVGDSGYGGYIDLAAPGGDMPVPANGGGVQTEHGTSFAAPFVTATVALVLATHHDLTPAQVRARIEATADPPPVTVPDEHYGWGIVNPYRAVTAVRDADAPVAAATAAVSGPLPSLPPVRPADRSLQHLSLGLAAGLFGVAVVVAVLAAVLRSTRRQGRLARPPA